MRNLEMLSPSPNGERLTKSDSYFSVFALTVRFITIGGLIQRRVLKLLKLQDAETCVVICFRGIQ